MSNSKDARARAEASFKRKEEQARQGAKAWAEYEAQRHAVAEKTGRLRALRLAKKAVETKRKDRCMIDSAEFRKKAIAYKDLLGWNPAWGSELRPQR